MKDIPFIPPDNPEAIFAWTYPPNAEECREMFTRRCPRICAYLDGICARFGLTEDLANQATYHFITKVMGARVKQ